MPEPEHVSLSRRYSDPFFVVRLGDPHLDDSHPYFE